MLRKIIIFIILIVFDCVAEDGSVKYEVKIIERLVLDITSKPNPKVCVVEYPSSYIQQYAPSLTVTNCNQADIVISSSDKDLSYNKPVLVVGFPYIKDGDIIGAIFWRKGRPQIILIEKNIQKFDINLPQEYRKYIIKKEFSDYVKADF